MKILILGATGQVGWELRRSLATLGDVRALNRAEADLADLDRLSAVVRAAQADVIINAAAYTAVDKAESERDLATRINAAAPGVLAAEAARAHALLVHYSTDYIFDGAKTGAYVETDAPAPLSHYGQSKWEGEEAVRASGCRYLIFRTSWVYAARGKNFARTILNAAKTRDSLRVVNDQIGAPTSAELIADVTALCLSRLSGGRAGTYHLTAAGETSWHGYAEKLLKRAAAKGHVFKATSVAAIPSSEYPTPAKRIANSRLNTDKLRSTFGVNLPAWDADLDRLIDELEPRP